MKRANYSQIQIIQFVIKMLFSVDKEKKEPIYTQLYNQIRGLIESGDLKEGYIMPSTRQMAQSLGINRSTVIRVYEELWSSGFFDSSPGSYTRVRKPHLVRGFSVEENGNESFWRVALSAGFPAKTDKIYRSGSRPGKEIINFKRLEPDPELIDKRAFRDCFNRTVMEAGNGVFGYSLPQGFEPLRDEIASHMRLHRINVSADNILITNGSQNSLHLLFQTFINPEDTIAIESPAYSMLIHMANYFRCRIVEIPVLTDGLDLSVLKDHLRRKRIKMLFTTPTFHNPTGVTTSPVKREKLLAICEENEIILIEDSIEEELKYFGNVHLPLKAMDRLNRVIYLGTFSKILSPGLRLGWIVADKECIKKLTTLKTIFDLSTNSFSQILVYNFLKSGYYELHLRRSMREYRKRMKTALKALKEHLPSEAASWSEPLGGYTIWIKLRKYKMEITPEEYMLKFGVLIADGSGFYITQPKEKHFRLSISGCNESQISEGIKRIGEALNNSGS